MFTEVLASQPISICCSDTRYQEDEKDIEERETRLRNKR